MSFVVLFSTTSFAITEHYCGDTLMDTAIFSKASSCGMETENTSSSSDCSSLDIDCCTDQQILKNAQDELQTSADKISFEQKVSNWNKDWAKVWKKDTQNIEIYDTKDAKAIGEKLNKAFAGMSVYPEYINDLNGAVERLATSGDMKTAFEVARINYNLYPTSSTTNATMGILHTLSGEKEKALSSFKKSLELNPNGKASADNLNTMAYDLKGIGQEKAGLQLLLLAVELHPKEANLFDSTGEFYINMKEIEKGIEFYKKALALDPNYPNAQTARKIVGQDSK